MGRRHVALALLPCLGIAVVLLRPGADAARRSESRVLERTAPLVEPAPHSVPEPLPDLKTMPLEEDATPPRRPPDPAPPGVLMGVVLMPDRSAATDALVVVTREETPDERREIRPDASGQVWIDRLAAGRYRLRATHASCAPHSFAFDVPEGGGAGPFDIVLSEGGTVHVRVVGAGETPLENRTVQVRQVYSREPQISRTDENGSARFERLPVGSYWVTCGEAPDGEGSGCTADVALGKTADVLLDLSCGLVGTLFDARGAPLGGATVRLAPKALGPGGYRYADASTDGAGRFELHGLPAGDYLSTVRIREPRYVVLALEPVALAEGEMRRCDLRIPPGRIEGRVTCAETGGPLAQDSVTIEAIPVEVEEGEVTSRHGFHPGWLTPSGWSAWYFARADAEGRYTLAGLPEGKYEVWVIAGGRSAEPVRTLVQVAGGPFARGLDFSIPLRAEGILRVRVLEHDGTPATGVFFSERVRDGVERSLTPKQVGDGLFEIALPVGKHVVDVYRLASGTVTAEVAEGATIDETVRFAGDG